MISLQLSIFLISLAYIFYILWWKFPSQIFYEKKYLYPNIVASIFCASIGFKIENAGLLFPVFVIIFTTIIDLISMRFRKKHFRAMYNMFPDMDNIFDVIFTLVVMLSTFITSILLLDLIKDCHFFG